MLESLRKFWAFLNKHSIAPWVIVVLTTVYVFGRWEASVSATEQRVVELRADTDTHVAEVKADLLRAQERSRDEILDRLDDIKNDITLRRDEERQTREKVSDLRLDVLVICARVKGACNHQ